MSTDRVRICVLLSGRGSNFEAILKASQADDYPAEIVLVASDQHAATGLETAQRADIPSLALPPKNYASKQAQEDALHTVLSQHGVELIVLAGYMRLLSSQFVERWPNRILNIHPSLLPAYPGLNTHKRALADGAEVHGCTVHIVDRGMDTGPILARSQLNIDAQDDEDSLAARVLKMEHRLYHRVIADFCDRMRGVNSVSTEV
ncbi:MAG: phosphoribosylglycinamide formyltransferase [Pseudomonadota bacterium]